MMKALRDELFRLSAAERLELIEQLWDSIAIKEEPLACFGGGAEADWTP